MPPKRTLAKVPCEEILDGFSLERLDKEFKLRTDSVKKNEFNKRFDDCLVRREKFKKAQKVAELPPLIRPLTAAQTPFPVLVEKDGILKPKTPAGEKVVIRIEDMSMTELAKQRKKLEFPKAIKEAFYAKYGVTVKNTKPGEYAVVMESPDKSIYAPNITGVYQITPYKNKKDIELQLVFDKIIIKGIPFELIAYIPSDKHIPYLLLKDTVYTSWDITLLPVEFTKILLRVAYFIVLDTWTKAYDYARNKLKLRPSMNIFNEIYDMGQIETSKIHIVSKLKLKPLPFPESNEDIKNFTDNWFDKLHAWLNNVQQKYKCEIGGTYHIVVKDGLPMFYNMIRFEYNNKYYSTLVNTIYAEKGIDIQMDVSSAWDILFDSKIQLKDKPLLNNDFMASVCHAMVQFFGTKHIYNRDNIIEQSVEQYKRFYNDITVTCYNRNMPISRVNV
jgi:peptidyl-tRNA hydrolase